MTLKERYSEALTYLEEHCPMLYTELIHEDSFQLLVAVVLSAQCTDARVNMITPKLFELYPTAEKLATATPEEIFPLIRSISYPNSKANYLVGLAQKLVNDYGGEIPSEIEQLTSLPGVGRKTANVIQALVFNKAALAVDTHVFRVSHRLGLVPQTATTPYAVEKTLVKHIATEQVILAHFWLLYHGRYTCTARQPKCNACGLTHCCKFFQKNNPKTEKKS